MKGFVLAQAGTVRTDWIDMNGHMNIRWYAALFDEGTSFVLARLGLATAADDVTLMAGRIFIAHKKELFEDEAWELWSGLASFDREGGTISHRLLAAGSLRATCDIRGEVVSLTTRKRSVLADRVVATAGALLVPGLRDRFAQP